MTNILLVDDRPENLLALEAILEPLGHQLVSVTSATDALKALLRDSFACILLDVQMPELDGFEVVRERGAARMPYVIFVTAYDEFAVRAFAVHAVDYLLKPVSAERLAEAIARVRLRAPGQPATPPVSALRPPVSERGPAERILVRDGTRVHVIDVDALDYVQARDDYVGFHSGGQEYLKEQPLAEVEAELDPRAFVRIHRSFIVNLTRIARVEPLTRDSRVVILKDGRRLPVSRSGYQRLTALLDGA